MLKTTKVQSIYSDLSYGPTKFSLKASFEFLWPLICTYINYFLEKMIFGWFGLNYIMPKLKLNCQKSYSTDNLSALYFVFTQGNRKYA